jgi:hypothetical protein
MKHKKKILKQEYSTTKGIDMKITELEKMETIVKNNKFLTWDGWTVVSMHPADSARTAKNGKYFDGKWSISKRFEPNRDGWDIPDKFVR